MEPNQLATLSSALFWLRETIDMVELRTDTKYTLVDPVLSGWSWDPRWQ